MWQFQSYFARYVYWKRDLKTERKTERQKDRETERQRDRKTERQSDSFNLVSHVVVPVENVSWKWMETERQTEKCELKSFRETQLLTSV
jgi:hypothetical protein